MSKTPHEQLLPQHVAIIMDGNGRWANAKRQPRHAGHRAGVETVGRVVEACGKLGIQHLTLFAFSSENWRRPATEVTLLMDLMLRAIEKETQKLHENNAQLHFIGNRCQLNKKLQAKMQAAETLTANNTAMQLTIAVNYGGQWDITQACNHLLQQAQAGEFAAAEVTTTQFAAALTSAELPAVDLLIRTGGEHRISNFLLWQLSYAELYFTDTFWPDFGAAELQRAVDWYVARERRFGSVTETMEACANA